MFSANLKGMRNRQALVLAGSFGLLLTASGPRALAGDNAANAASYTPVAEGSTLIHRSQVDAWSGQVYIYVGSHVPEGTNLVSFRYLFDSTEKGNTGGYITPLLFEYQFAEAFTVYTVVGIGKGFEVALKTAPQTIPFDVIDGTKVPTGRNFTFGYINALVNSSGVPIETSPGTVDMDNPADTGEGAGRTGTTNDWIATANLATPNPVVTLGTTFGAGPGVNYPIVSPYRTYSAQALGAIPAP